MKESVARVATYTAAELISPADYDVSRNSIIDKRLRSNLYTDLPIPSPGGVQPLRRGGEVPFPHTAQRAERDGQGAGEEEDHIPHHAQPFQLVVGAAHQECQAARVPIPVGDGTFGARKAQLPDRRVHGN